MFFVFRGYTLVVPPGNLTLSGKCATPRNHYLMENREGCSPLEVPIHEVEGTKGPGFTKEHPASRKVKQMGLQARSSALGDPPRSLTSARRRHNRKGGGRLLPSSSLLSFGVNIPRCGVFLMLCVLFVIAFEFALMHRHDLDKHSNADHHFSPPGMGSLFGGGVVPPAPPPPPNHTKLPLPPSMPDSSKPDSKFERMDHAPDEEGGDKQHPWSQERKNAIGAVDASPLQQHEGLGSGVPPSQVDDTKGNEYGDMRVAVLVPYAGPGLPLWFDAFTDLAAASSAAVDWLIFCDQVRVQKKLAYVCFSAIRLLLGRWCAPIV